MFKRFFGSKPHAEAASSLYEKLVAQARRREFYAAAGVPDTLDGRFDLVVLHAFLVMHRLKTGGDDALELSQALFDHMFADLDGAIREMGAGDIGVPKKVRQMISAFYGRVTAYEVALAGEAGDLAAAVSRNVYRAEDGAADGAVALARYVEAQIEALAAQEEAALLSGKVEFLAPELQ